ncbi:MAG TPA: N-acetyltransferase [Nocardioidaceae bacterium]|nr:N-acetyltransferase [Nocardioidaceae bacterium]
MTATEPLIEPERHDDVSAIDEVVRAAFGREQVVDLVRQIRASPHYLPELALVARRDALVVGFVMLSGVDLVADGGERRAVLALSPLAVAPEVQDQGIGSALVAAGLAAAARTSAPMVTLEGSPRYYGRLGFERAARHDVRIDLPDWAPPEAAQVFLLPSYRPAIRGRLDYPPAFATLA